MRAVDEKQEIKLQWPYEALSILWSLLLVLMFECVVHTQIVNHCPITKTLSPNPP